MFTSSELDCFVKDVFKVFEVFSFLDRTIRVLAKKIEDCSTLQEDFAAVWLGLLSCTDKAIRDGSQELATLFSMRVLRKRELWCTFTSEVVTPSQRLALLFGPLDRSALFPRATIEQIAYDLQKKSTQDLLLQSTRRAKEPTRGTSV